MATETVEMSSVTSNAAANTATVCRPWFANRANAFVALVFALVGIAFAVGLGSGDWYVVEFSTYGGSTVVPAQFSPGSFPVTFSTNVYGLRIGYQCFGPQTAVSYGANAATQGTNGGLQQCVPFTYRSKYLYFNWVSGNSQATSDQTSAANDAVTAYTHLIGASGIIIALLGLGVVIAAHQFLVHIFGAHGVYAPGVISGRISLVILIILEALVLIFWITILPVQLLLQPGRKPVRLAERRCIVRHLPHHRARLFDPNCRPVGWSLRPFQFPQGRRGAESQLGVRKQSSSRGRPKSDRYRNAETIEEAI